jgi:hypothetical protein
MLLTDQTGSFDEKLRYHYKGNFFFFLNDLITYAESGSFN